VSAIPGLPEEGEILGGKYRIERTLGAGGMGVVVAAFHVHLREKVAIKVLRPDASARPASIARFVREARTTMKLRSDHIVRVFDVDMIHGALPYIVMEFLDGQDLARILEAEGPLPVGRAIEYLLQGCEGIAEAHALGVIHRDLKPANMFVAQGKDGAACVKLLDFGVSKASFLELDVGEETKPSSERPIVTTPPARPVPAEITHTNAQLGSPRYMSPEQIRSARSVDVRTDVWALGTILYEAISGAPAFRGRTADDLTRAILEDDPPPLARERQGVPAGLDAIVRRCLAKDARDRYPDVAALAAALAPFAPSAARESATRVRTALYGSTAASQHATSVDAVAAPAAARARRSLAWPVGLGAVFVALVALTVGLGRVGVAAHRPCDRATAPTRTLVPEMELLADAPPAAPTPVPPRPKPARMDPEHAFDDPN
jgi:serine/threonine-protein kinase